MLETVTPDAPAPGTANPKPARPDTPRMLLHVGCGPKRAVGSHPLFAADRWGETRLDTAPAVAPDAVASMTALQMVPEASPAEGFSPHNLTHPVPHALRAATR